MILKTEMKILQKCTYNYINADVTGMKSYMMKIKWKQLQNKNMEEMWCIFSNILNKYRNVCTKGWEKKKITCGWTVQHIKHKKQHTKYDIYNKLKTESNNNKNNNNAFI